MQGWNNFTGMQGVSDFFLTMEFVMESLSFFVSQTNLLQQGADFHELVDAWAGMSFSMPQNCRPGFAHRTTAKSPFLLWVCGAW